MKNELEKLKDRIEKNYQADMAAINQLLSAYSQERTQVSKELTAYVEASRPKKDVALIIEEEIKKLDGDFTTDDVYFKLSAAIGKTPSISQARRISQVINKLRQRDPAEITVVTAGVGRRSGTYRVAK